MHGTVLLDEDQMPLQHAILWADQRSGGLCEEINHSLTLDRLARLIGNRLSPGFMASTLAWLRKEDEGGFDQIHTSVLPKDYVRMKLTGTVKTEFSDAAGTGLLDIREKVWAADLCHALNISPTLLPPLSPSRAIDAHLTTGMAETLSLYPGTPVVMGGADQAMAALGHGVTEPGELLITIGTGGQIFAPTKEPLIDPGLRLNAFCHAVEDRWYLLGATLSAGLSLRWFRDKMLRSRPLDYRKLEAEASPIPPCSEGLIFLPYLIGERTPHMRGDLAGAFFGLHLQHSTGHLVRAIMEGVAFSLREVIEVMIECGIRAERIIISGGGGASKLWREILSSVLNKPMIYEAGIKYAAPLGAALLAGLSMGHDDLPAKVKTIANEETLLTEPSSSSVDHYEKQYQRYRALYPVIRDLSVSRL
jgi:xylulokinase